MEAAARVGALGCLPGVCLGLGPWAQLADWHPSAPSQVFYGGHITDNMDRRCCTTYLQVAAAAGKPRQPHEPSPWRAPGLQCNGAAL